MRFGIVVFAVCCIALLIGGCGGGFGSDSPTAGPLKDWILERDSLPKSRFDPYADPVP